MIQRPTTRQGIALLITLAFLVLITVTVAAIAGLAASVQLERDLDRSERIANSLRRSAEPLILTWLDEHSPSVVLPSDATSPEVAVLHHVWHDSLSTTGRTYELRITAWDQHGMVPAPLVRSGSPLRNVLPEAILRELEQHELTDTTSAPGLDLYLDVYIEDKEATAPVARSPFPLPASEHELMTFAAQEGAPPVGSGTQLPFRTSETPALGALVATHMADGPSQSAHAPHLNVNTAPLDLIETAFRETGRSGIELIRTARDEGKPVALGQLPAAPHRSGREQPVAHFTGSSTVWTVRIDVRVDRLQRSWWRVYRKSNAASAGATDVDDMIPLTASPGHQWRLSSSSAASTLVSRNWECVQSIVITQ